MHVESTLSNPPPLPKNLNTVLLMRKESQICDYCRHCSNTGINGLLNARPSRNRGSLPPIGFGKEREEPLGRGGSLACAGTLRFLQTARGKFSKVGKTSPVQM